MTEAERIHRSQEAARLADEPILAHALERMEREAWDRMLDLPSTAQEERWQEVCRLKVIRGFRDELRSVILDGQDLARKRPGPP